MLQRGIALCLEHKVLAVLLNLCISAVDVCFSLQHSPDAESYPDRQQRRPPGLLDPFVDAHPLERRGDAKSSSGNSKRRSQSYRRCLEISRMYEIFPRWTSVLEKQAGALDRAERPSDGRAAREERARVH